MASSRGAEAAIMLVSFQGAGGCLLWETGYWVKSTFGETGKGSSASFFAFQIGRAGMETLISTGILMN